MRFEYYIMDLEEVDERGYLSTRSPNDAELNDLGTEGWELVCSFGRALIFKRPKEAR